MTTVEYEPSRRGLLPADFPATELQELLRDLLALQLLAKQLHWNVRGANFWSLHVELDGLAQDARDWSDQLAERLVALGIPPDGRPSTVALSSLSMPEAGSLAERQVLQLTVDALRNLANSSRSLSRKTEAELGTQDLLISLVNALEKHLWMFAAQLS
jgi:starvation-inducible DNA-binding protein